MSSNNWKYDYLCDITDGKIFFLDIVILTIDILDIDDWLLRAVSSIVLTAIYRNLYFMYLSRFRRLEKNKF